MMTLSARRITLALCAIAFGVASCGGPGASRPTTSSRTVRLIDDASATLESARSVKVTGDITLSSARSGTVDIVVFGNGEAEGTIATPTGTLDVVQTNVADYVRASAGIWQSLAHVPPATAKHLAVEWINIPLAAASALDHGISLHSAASALADPSAKVHEIARTTIDGVEAVELKSSKGFVVWVRATGTHYVVAARGAFNGASGDLRFSGWNTFSLPSPPKRSVPLSSLAGAAPA